MNTKQSIDLVREEANACIDVEVAQDKFDSYLSAIQSLHIWEDRIIQLTEAKALKCTDVRVAGKYLRSATKVANIWKDRVNELVSRNAQEQYVKSVDVELVQGKLSTQLTTGNDVRQMRLVLGYTVREFANVLKVPPGTLGSWEARPSLSKKAKPILVEFVRQHEEQLKMLGASWTELQLKQHQARQLPD